jgi:lysine 2,3-aminomutase
MDCLTTEPRVEADFVPASQGYWPEVPSAQWNVWKWQLKNRVTDLAGLEKHLVLTPEERAGVILSGSKLALAVTPHYFNLIERDNPACPIRRQIIPHVGEGYIAPGEFADPCGEDDHMPVPGLVHRYPDRVLFLVTDRCEQELHTDFDRAITYLERHTEVRDVLLSGGDPLLFSDDKLDALLGRLRAIPHIEFVRIGTRVPVFLPQRITPEFCRMIQKHHPLWMSIHTNHPRELTTEVRDALAMLANHGVPLGNQSVLLAGVNDSLPIMKSLVQKLLRCRVRPYYLYQCDLIQGSAHLRAPVRVGLEIIEGLRGHTTGYAVPQFVIDAPGGGGKVPINPSYVFFHDREKVVFRNFEGRVFEYPEVQSAQSFSQNVDHSSLEGMISGSTNGVDSEKAVTC